MAAMTSLLRLILRSRGLRQLALLAYRIKGWRRCSTAHFSNLSSSYCVSVGAMAGAGARPCWGRMRHPPGKVREPGSRPRAAQPRACSQELPRAAGAGEAWPAGGGRCAAVHGRGRGAGAPTEARRPQRPDPSAPTVPELALFSTLFYSLLSFPAAACTCCILYPVLRHLLSQAGWNRCNLSTHLSM